MQEISSKIISTGSYLPKKIVTNNDLAKTIDTSDEWITERTGIKQRHIAAEDELTSDLGYKAAINAIEGSNIEKNDIDIIIVATTTADNIFPSVATKIQEKLSITNCFAFDVQAACSGFVYGLVLADSLIKTQQYKNILLIGCETLSRIVNWQDRTTSVLFGDGAGAVIISKNQEDDSGIISHSLSSDGSLYEILKTSGGPSLTGGEGHIIMQGQEVFKNAVNKMYQSVNDLLKKSNFLIDDIDLFIPHQANQRILKKVALKLGLKEDKMVSTVAMHANTSAASIPLALDFACKKKLVRDKDIIIFEALGAGITWGTVLYKW